MDVPRPYRPQDPAAYDGRPGLSRAAVTRAAGIQAGLLLLLVVTGLWQSPAGWLLVGAATLVNVRVVVQRLLARRHDPPFVVDRPGVFVATDDATGRLVHWESISALVLTELTSVRSGHRRRVPGIGLRLRDHPDVLAVRCPLEDRALELGQLTAAVARFAPAGVEVTEQPPPGAEVTARDVVLDVAGRIAGRLRRDVPDGSPQPGPDQAAAYVARDAAGVARLVVDAAGVGFGPGVRRGAPAAARRYGWGDVGAVVVLDVETAAGWRRAVGVLPPGAPADWTPGHLADLRTEDGWAVDRAGLEYAVRLHGPRVPVVDGPPARRVRAADVATLLVRAYQGRPKRADHYSPDTDPERQWRVTPEGGDGAGERWPGLRRTATRAARAGAAEVRSRGAARVRVHARRRRRR
jgi:hypothetical protein